MDRIAGLTRIDALVLVGYAVLVFTAGASQFRRNKGPREFYLAGRAAGPVAVGVSLMVSLASSLGYVAVPTAAKRSGLIMLWSLLALPLCYPVVVRVFIPFFQRLHVYTAYEYLEQRFNRPVRLLASALFIAWRITWMGAVLYVPAMALHVGTDGRIPVVLGVAVLGLLATSYTALGGLRGVYWADNAQFVVMFGGILVALISVCSQVHGGLAGVWLAADHAGKLAWTAAESPLNDGSLIGAVRYYLYTDFTVPAIIAAFTVSKLANYGVDQLLVQRLLSARSAAIAARGFLFNCVAFALFFCLMTITGLAISAYAGVHPFPSGLRPDEVFPYYMAHWAPNGMAGLMIAGLIAAAVSSVDSGINAVATAVCNDFYSGEVGTPAPVHAGRVTTVVIGVAAVAVGCVIGNVGDIFEIALKVVNSFAAPLLAMFVLAMFSRRATARGVYRGTLFGCAITALLVFARPVVHALAANESQFAHAALHFAKNFDISFLLVTPLGFVISLSAGYVLSVRQPEVSERYQAWSFGAVIGNRRTADSLSRENAL